MNRARGVVRLDRMLAAAAGGAAAAVALRRYGGGAEGIAWVGAIALLVELALHDVRTRRVPNLVTGPAALVILVLRGAFAASTLPSALLAGGCAFAVFLALAILARGGLGMGDVKLAGLLGLMLGPAVTGALLLGVLVGGIASLAAAVAHRRVRGVTLAYAPYLVLGAVAAILALHPPGLV